jgi:putative PEP-CTERM system histidine kinase
MTALVNYMAAGVGSLLVLAALYREARTLARNAFLLGMSSFACASLFAGLSAQATSPEAFVFWQRLKLLASAPLPGSWLLFSVSFARGNSVEFVKRWRWILVAAFLLPAAAAAAFTLSRLVPELRGTPDEPWQIELGAAELLFVIMLMIGHVLALMNLEKTLRAAVGTMRWRIKFMILGLGVVFVVRLYTGSQVLLYSVLDPRLDAMNAGALVVGSLLMVRGLQRARFSAVDVYPSAAVLRGSLTVLIAGVYLLVVGALAEILTRLGGEAALRLKNFVVLVALVVLTVLLLSNRVRLSIRAFVSRHFRRPQHDHARVWKAFADQTTSVVDKHEFCRAAVRLVSETLDVLSVTMWIVDDVTRNFRFGGSTSLSERQASALAKPWTLDADLAAKLASDPSPVDIDASGGGWMEDVKQRNPDVFRRGGDRICVPLLARGTVLGLMVVGDRVGGHPYTAEDLALLKTIGAQIGASLMSQRLSEQLLEAKEMEAFQTMSTFFVHDLKNTASTLSLLLQNLPRHFDEPEFRRDALVAVERSVRRINDLIQRLSSLRSSVDMEVRGLADLNQIVRAALAELTGARSARIVSDLKPMAPVRINSDQMRTVVTNLVNNALEASGENGAVHVGTSASGGWAVISVRDAGCGMTPEFLQHSLFHPFRTTKQKGLGIGLFQSRRIVESHKGRIEVTSEPGKGSTFRVCLPLPGAD